MIPDLINPEFLPQLIEQTNDMLKALEEATDAFQRTLDEVAPILASPESASLEDKVNALVRMQGALITSGATTLSKTRPVLAAYRQMMDGMAQAMREGPHAP